MSVSASEHLDLDTLSIDDEFDLDVRISVGQEADLPTAGFSCSWFTCAISCGAGAVTSACRCGSATRTCRC